MPFLHKNWHRFIKANIKKINTRRTKKSGIIFVFVFSLKYKCRAVFCDFKLKKPRRQSFRFKYNKQKSITATTIKPGGKPENRQENLARYQAICLKHILYHYKKPNLIFGKPEHPFKTYEYTFLLEYKKILFQRNHRIWAYWAHIHEWGEPGLEGPGLDHHLILKLQFQLNICFF